MARFYGCGVIGKALRNAKSIPKLAFSRVLWTKDKIRPSLSMEAKAARVRVMVFRLLAAPHVFFFFVFLSFGLELLDQLRGFAKMPIGITRSISAQPSWCSSGPIRDLFPLPAPRVSRLCLAYTHRAALLLLPQAIYMLINFAEIQACFGSDATVGGIKFQFNTRIKTDVKLIQEARKNGADCKDITLGGSSKGQTFTLMLILADHLVLFIPRSLLTRYFLEMQKHMGEDVTVSALKWQFSVPIRADAKRLQEARAAGVDCQTIALSGPGGSFKGGKSQIRLRHFFHTERFRLGSRPNIDKA